VLNLGLTLKQSQVKWTTAHRFCDPLQAAANVVVLLLVTGQPIPAHAHAAAALHMHMRDLASAVLRMLSVLH
jgi:hypothetical protein